MTTTPEKRTRRSNSEILQAMIDERKAPRKHRRRTKSQIERDTRLIEKAKREKAAARASSVYVVTVVTPGQYLLGAERAAGERVEVLPGTREYGLAFDKNKNFVLDKTPEQQLAEWGEIRYTVSREVKD